MMTVTMSLVVASSLVGTAHCGHHKVRGEYSVCSEENPAVLGQVMKLQTAPSWIARRKAARALGKYDWKCHPEAAEALAEALLHDDKALVRQEAAESLAKMRPCLPVAHEAVAKAARCDSCFLTRLWAKKALKSIGKSSCEEGCSICGPAEGAEDDAALPIPPDSGPLPMDSAVEPLAPTIRVEPTRPSEPSPFQPGVTPPERSAVPLPEALPERVPADGPPLEMPSLPPSNPAPAPGPGLTGPMSSRPTPSRLEEESIPIRRLDRPVFPVIPGRRPNLAGSLLGVQP
jgi:hypothetical protein